MDEPGAAATAPFGSWRSPLSIGATLAGDVEWHSLCADGDDLLWVETVVDQDGRNTLMRRRGGAVREVTAAPIDVRSRVNGYGGGAFHAAGGSVAWCDDRDNTVWLTTPDGVRHRIGAGTDRYRYGDLRVAPDLPGVLAVREEALPNGVATTIVALPWPAGETAAAEAAAGTPGGQVLCTGADFYACPEYGPDGRLAWVQWNHPDMPWDASVLWVAPVRLAGGRITLDSGVRVAGGGTGDPRYRVSVQHPRWLPDRRLLFMSDASGYWNLYQWDGTVATAVHEDACDFDSPAWQLGNHAYTMLDDDLAFVSLCDEGIVYLGTVRLSTGEVARATSVAQVKAVAAVDGIGYALVTRPAAPPALVCLTEDGTVETIRQATGLVPEPAWTAIPRSLTFTGRAGQVQAWFYPPTNGAWHGPPGERPVLLVCCHGGPTGFASDAWQADIQFWTSRGFAYLDVNYSGSAGFGRAYRNRLWGQWGLLDVSDCVDAIQAVVGLGLADPKRVAIRGGSAGGYTVLQVLTTTDVCAAGVSRYGVADLEMLARDTHKFESHYLDRLVGPYPDRRDIYVARSPLYHLDRLSTPALLMQGTDDLIVTPAQARAMADALRRQQAPVALLMFEGEGHGFRKQSTRRSALAAELSFYAQMFGFSPADQIDAIAIDNLPPEPAATRASHRAEIDDTSTPASTSAAAPVPPPQPRRAAPPDDDPPPAAPR